MGQHTFQTKDKNHAPVTVRAGWDRPLKQFFLVVEFDDEKDHTDENNGMLYSNLDDDAASGCQDFKYFEDKLQELGVGVPRSFIKNVRFDAMQS
jgi:hypothetical protein